MASGYGGIRVGGPYFDDLSKGQVFDWAPGVTLSLGLAAAHQSIVGNRLRLALDSDLCAAVTGMPGPLAHPGLVCDVAIGQSTLATQRVKANLFYRGLRFHRFPAVGDTLYTRTEVVGLRANSPKPGRAPTGLAGLRMTTIDRTDRLVLDFYRCAMLPASPDWKPGAVPGDDLSRIGADAPAPAADPTAHWDGAVFRKRVPGPHFDAGIAGAVLHSTADLVSGAPELARLTSISLLRTMIGGSADDGWSTAGIPSDWHSRRQPGYCLTWRPSWTGNPATTPLRYTRATPSTASCISSLRRPTQTGCAGTAVTGLRGQRFGE